MKIAVLLSMAVKCISHLMSAYYLQGILWDALHVLSHLFLTEYLECRHF